MLNIKRKLQAAAVTAALVTASFAGLGIALAAPANAAAPGDVVASGGSTPPTTVYRTNSYKDLAACQAAQTAEAAIVGHTIIEGCHDTVTNLGHALGLKPVYEYSYSKPQF